MSAADRLRRLEALAAEAEAERARAPESMTDDELRAALDRLRRSLLDPRSSGLAWKGTPAPGREPGGADPEADVELRRMTDDELLRELNRLRAEEARRAAPAGEPEASRNSRESDDRAAPAAPGTPEAPRPGGENVVADPGGDAGAAPAGEPGSDPGARRSEEPAGGDGEGAAEAPRPARENVAAPPAPDAGEPGSRADPPLTPDEARFLAEAEALVAAERRRLARLDAAAARDERRDPPPGWTGSVAHGSAATPEFRRATGGG